MGSVYDFVVGGWFVGIPHSVKWKMTALATVIFLDKTTQSYRKFKCDICIPIIRANLKLSLLKNHLYMAK